MTKETDRIHSGSQIKPSTLTSKKRARFQDRNKEFEAALVPTQETIAVHPKGGGWGEGGLRNCECEVCQRTAGGRAREVLNNN